MFEFIKTLFLWKNLRNIGPALIILSGTLIVSILFSEFSFIFGMKALGKALFRFFRLLLLLTIPILLLPGILSIMGRIFNRGSRQLLQTQKNQDTAIHPIKNWIIRPFQGIGLSMLFTTRLLTLLELYSGYKIDLGAVLPQGGFNLGRFSIAAAIGVSVSLLLSLLWTLDDLGVRYYNKKTGELRMIGKYVGVLLPLSFGLYGIISLFDNNNHVLAGKYVIQMVAVLYPPFVVFNVIHSFFLKKRSAVLLRRLKVFHERLDTEDGEEILRTNVKSENRLNLSLP
jgi:hypothetical protein